MPWSFIFLYPKAAKMQRKIYLAFLFIVPLMLSFFSLRAQHSPDTASLANIRSANDLKTGNWQDLFSNFFQLSSSDLTGPHKAFNFQSTIFAMKAKANPGILVDTNYLRHRFDRNFQFNFSVGLDTNYHFSGFSGGVTWALINKRDSTVISFVGSNLDGVFKKFAYLLIDDLRAFRKQFVNERGEFVSDSARKEYAAVKTAVDSLLGSPHFDTGKLPAPFADYLKGSPLVKYYDSVEAAYCHALADARTKPLLTAALRSAFNKTSGFDSAKLEFVYLQGLTKTGRSMELDLRGGLVVKDSLVGSDHFRTRMTTSGGCNFALISSIDPRSKSYVSIVEMKPYIEYDRILSARLAGEKAGYFYASADLRVRVTENCWIPFTVKYDFNRKNLLGLLNVSFNMNAFKTAKKTI
jgi:hypothetical protein